MTAATGAVIQIHTETDMVAAGDILNHRFKFYWGIRRAEAKPNASVSDSFHEASGPGPPTRRPENLKLTPRSRQLTTAQTVTRSKDSALAGGAGS